MTVSSRSRSTPSNRSRTNAERTPIRDAALDEIETALKGLGYAIKRETGCVLVLRRIGGDA